MEQEYIVVMPKTCVPLPQTGQSVLACTIAVKENNGTECSVAACKAVTLDQLKEHRIQLKNAVRSAPITNSCGKDRQWGSQQSSTS